MRRTSLCTLAIFLGYGVLAVVAPPAVGDGSDDRAPTAGATVSDELPPHLRAIQHSLGGSVLQQFDALQSTPSPPPWWKQFDQAPQATATDSPQWPTADAASGPTGATDSTDAWHKWWATPAQPLVPATASAPVRSSAASPAVAALRMTAAELDESANRLEDLELYRQSDALRELAQRLRVDARQLTAGGASSLQPPRLLNPGGMIAPVDPAAPSGGWVQPGPTAPMPTFTPDPTPMPSLNEPQPSRPIDAAEPSRAPLEPTPASETPADAVE